MGILIFATAADLVAGDWLDDLPLNAGRLIRSASVLVSTATRLDVYDVTDDGLPSAPGTAAAFRDAVCQQVTEWAGAGIDPLKGGFGQAPKVSSQSVDGGSVGYTGYATVEQIAKAATSLSESARQILRNAGLASGIPRHR